MPIDRRRDSGTGSRRTSGRATWVGAARRSRSRRSTRRSTRSSPARHGVAGSSGSGSRGGRARGRPGSAAGVAGVPRGKPRPARRGAVAAFVPVGAGSSAAGYAGKGVCATASSRVSSPDVDAPGQVGQRRRAPRPDRPRTPDRHGRRGRARRRRPRGRRAPPRSPASRAGSCRRTRESRRSRAGRRRRGRCARHADDDVVIGVAATEVPQLDRSSAQASTTARLGERPVGRVDDDLRQVGRELRVSRRRSPAAAIRRSAP